MLSPRTAPTRVPLVIYPRLNRALPPPSRSIRRTKRARAAVPANPARPATRCAPATAQRSTTFRRNPRQKSPVKQKESSLDFLPRKERNRRLIQRSGIPRRASFASEPEVSADTSRLRPDTPILPTLHRARSSTLATPARFFVPSRESPRYSPSRSRQTPSSSHRTC